MKRRPPEQLDIYRHSPARLAEAWRVAAETSRQQSPNDTKRYRYYLAEAERLDPRSGRSAP